MVRVWIEPARDGVARYELKVKFTTLKYGFRVEEEEEYIVNGDNVLLNRDGSLTVICQLPKRQRKETIAPSMVQSFRQI